MKNFNQVKKHSEGYARLMRDNFPSAFEKEELNTILTEIVFNDEKKIFHETLTEEGKVSEFKNFIYSQLEDEWKVKEVTKTTKELLTEVGYDFYICKKEEDALPFKKYYKNWEVICTFNNLKSRLANYHTFWIVKKNIDEIEHQWANRNRQDIYGTSCCSIQINKRNKNDISIKNRYNHKVSNCDATFSNNLDNIAEGLTSAMNKEFNLQVEVNKSTFELDKFIFKDNKFIYYNYEINNIYYWINKYYKDWELTILNTDKYILIDYFLINLKEKRIEKIDNNINDDFFNFRFNKIVIKKDNFHSDEDKEWVLIIYK